MRSLLRAEYSSHHIQHPSHTKVARRKPNNCYWCGRTDKLVATWWYRLICVAEACTAGCAPGRSTWNGRTTVSVALAPRTPCVLLPLLCSSWEQPCVLLSLLCSSWHPLLANILCVERPNNRVRCSPSVQCSSWHSLYMYIYICISLSPIPYLLDLAALGVEDFSFLAFD
jgi:hypothetical protein